MIFLFSGVVLDVAQVIGHVFFFLDYLDSSDPDSWTVSLSTSVTFFEVLDLKLISDRRGLRLSLFLGHLIVMLLLGVLFVLLGLRTMIFWAPEIDLPNVRRRL